MTTVAEIMSYGVQTVEANATLADVIGKLRRIGHEGYPVKDADGAVVGLLTQRDFNRAAENGLAYLTVRDVMEAGRVTVLPHTPIAEATMRVVETGWGQLPVLDATGALIGIVTRTDLLRYYAGLTDPARHITLEDLRRVLGEPSAGLVEFVARAAEARGLTLYLVGGVVRDLLLNRPNFDLDFVVEGDAIAFAEALHVSGKITTFAPFGTAKWTLDANDSATVGHPLADLPDHIDFATARHEYYEQPTALPTVYKGGIKLDLRRRDFTINAMALILRTDTVLVLFGGLDDLRNRRIRALHSLSFADDPTRTLRAVRFSHRLGFEIEARTAATIERALPMLGRITGERLRNELSLLLKEMEPESALIRLDAMGVLRAIQPAFTFGGETAAAFRTARAEPPPWGADDVSALYWHLIAAHLEGVAGVVERLVFDMGTAESMIAAMALVRDADALLRGKPSEIVARLPNTPGLALAAAWVLLPRHRETLTQLVTNWRTVRPHSTGHTLQQMGLKPGPQFGRLLARLRDAWLDGEITTADEEQRLLRRWLDEETNDDN